MSGKREAMKIMEALSGVDEELLERCEAEGSGAAAPENSAEGKGKYRSRIWRYAGSCAAALCLAAVGAAGWGGIRLAMDAEKLADEPFSLESVSDRIAEIETAEPEQQEPEQQIRQEREQQPAQQEKQDAEGGIADNICDEFNDSVTESVMLNPAQRLTEEQARQTGELGAALPTVLPEGYSFESAYYYEEENSLSVCWTRGMDSIMLSLEYVDAEEAELTDISKPESYDERLYEIPFAETVPREYWETMNNPVFAWEDFSLDIIRSRVLAGGGDSGDTSTPRGNFAVLYPEGMLIRFNGRGTPEQIWELFSSIDAQ